MKNLKCKVIGNSIVIKALANCLNELGHNVIQQQVPSHGVDYNFIDTDLDNSSKFYSPPHIWFKMESDSLLVFLGVANKRYLFKNYNLEDFFDLNECLEDFIIYLARTDIDSEIISNLPQIDSENENLSSSSCNSSDKFSNIVDWFKEISVQSGIKEAIVDTNLSVSYSQLDSDSDMLAKQILSTYQNQFANQNLQDQLIGIMLGRDSSFIIAELGVLKSGAGFVPMDSSLPTERLDYIIHDAQIKLVVTDKQSASLLEDLGIKTLIFNTQNKLDTPNENIILPKVTANSIAYVIYTSGTTGNPKGVVIEHSSLNHLTYSTISKLKLSSYDRVMQFAKFSFDASVWEIFPSLLCGAILYICNEDERTDINKLVTFIAKHKISIATFPPALLKVMPHIKYDDLTTIIIAGETCDNKTVTFWSQGRKFINAYGPTETTVCASMHEYKYNDLPNNIGKPIGNTQLYVLDEMLNPVAEGIIGELYIGGAGVARGYLNKPELTKERFIKNNFATDEDIAKGYTRLYKTGDLVRWTPDANLEYIGRNDFQVKVRGYRIEPGEIEECLHQHPQITMTVVLFNKSFGNDGGLVAYYVSKTGQEINNLRSYLIQSLPEYMIPGLFILIDKVPLTANGKIDRNELLAIELPAIRLNDADYEEVVTPTEKFLQSEWRKLLKVSTAGRNSSFFELGGHSVLVMRLLGDIRREYNCNLVPKDIFENPTLVTMARVINFKCSNRNLDAKENENIVITRINDIRIPATPVQKSYWLIDYFGDKAAKLAFLTPVFYNILIKLDSNVLEQAIRDLILRHEILRTRFIEEDGIVYQIRDLENINFQVETGTKAELGSWIEQQANAILDIEHGPLFIPALYQISDTGGQVLSLTHHHILADGYSIDVMLRDLFIFYEQHQGEKVKLPELNYQYGDFGVWHAKQLLSDKQMQINHEEYWQIHLPKNPEFSIPGDQSRPSQLTYQGDVLTFNLQKELRENLAIYAKEYKVTEFTILLTAFYVLLAKYTGESRVNVGIPFANRQYPEVENIVGCLINTLPFEYDINSEHTVLQLINDINYKFNNLLNHSSWYYPSIIEHFKIKNPNGFSPLYQILFVSELFNIEREHADSYTSIVERINYLNKTAKVDFSCYLLTIEDELIVNFEYNTNIYSSQTINSLGKYYQQILSEILSKKQNIKEINFIDNATLYKLRQWGRGSEIKFPGNLNLVKAFKENAKRYPDNIALVFKDKSFSYKEVDTYSDYLAGYFLKQHIAYYGKPIAQETKIILAYTRDSEIILAILATLKLGSTFVPVDVNNGIERVKYIVEDTKAPILVTNSKLYKDELDSKILCIKPNIDDYNSNKYGQLPLVDLQENNAAYILYTSGTTGKPKGVVVTHQNLLNLYYSNYHQYCFSPNDRIAQYCSFSFDSFCADWSSALLSGASLYILSERIKLDIHLFAKFLEMNDITYMDIPTAVIHLFTAEDFELLKNMRVIKVGGEKLKHLKISGNPGFRLFNAYGPTETSVESVLYEITDFSNNHFPIGKPIGNTQLYVLDEMLNPVAEGVAGELYIGGAGVARGYLNKPELTKERFIKNNFATDEDIAKGYTRLYKTGDLVRWTPDANLEYIGRNDFQVKVRGYRIEPGEIEECLHQHPQIIMVVVLFNKSFGSDGGLVAYYVSKTGQEINDLRSYLIQSLPEYMIPGLFILLDKIPLTVNGKIDRNVLLTIELPEPKLSSTDYEEIITPTEKFLQLEWKKLLKVTIIDRNSNFFELGGHSVLIMRLLGDIRREYNCNLVPKDIFENPTLVTMAQIIEFKCSSNSLNTKEPKASSITRIIEIKIPATPVQQALYIIHNYDHLSARAYTTPLLFNIEGNLNCLAFEQAIKSLILRHEILRTRFIEENGIVYQVRDIKNINLRVETGTELELESWIEKQASSILDMERGPLFIPALYQTTDTQRHVLSMTHHHILADDYSIDIMLRDLFLLYYQHRGEKVILPELHYQYGDFGVWHAKELLANKQTQINYEQYWQTHLPKTPEFSIPGDQPRPAQLTYQGDVLTFNLQKELRENLTSYAKEHKVTEFTIMLAAFYVLLAKYSGESIVNAGIPFANRHYPEVENIVGCLINTLPFEYEINSELTTLQLIQDVNKKFINLQEMQGTSSLMLAEKLPVVASGYNSLYQIMFVIQNTFDELQLADLKLTTIHINNKTSKYDLSFQIQDSADNLVFNIEYNSYLYSKNTIERLFKYYIVVLTTLISKNTLVKNISLIDDTYLTRILQSWTRNDKKNSSSENVIKLFMKQVQIKPEHLAIICNRDKLTYRELDLRSTQLSNYLIEKHANNSIVAILLERNIDLVIAVLAVIKSGEAYLPLSTNLPMNRINYMLKNARVNCIISSSNLDFNLSEQYETIHIDKFNYNLFSGHYTNIILNSDPAYVIYTSGSTGEPKGIMVEHGSLQNTILALNQIYTVTDSKFRISAFASFIFDVFTSELFASLTFGGELHLLSDEIRMDVNLLAKYFVTEKINFCFLPPVVLEMLPRQDYPDLDAIVFAGEPCSAQAGTEWSDKVRLYNCYGPTETTIYATMSRIYPETNINCIGKPLTNTLTYVLDKNLNILPSRMTGELYIGGAGVARGYLNNQKLTEERFITNKFATDEDILKGYTKLYKTGDLVRWLPDGNLEYIGRNDFQVKLRGYRIELGEIENILSSHINSQQVAALVDNRVSGGILIAYFVCKNNNHTNNIVTELRELAISKLPSYMVPTLFIELKEMPLSENGKINRKALHNYTLDFSQLQHHIKPASSLELTLLELFINVLGINNLGVEHNFFDNGGNSIQAAKLIAQINSRFNKNFMISSLYQRPTVKQFVCHMNLDYQPLVKLNICPMNNTTKLFMFHTARGSAEVYFNFAREFSEVELIGIESYNLYNSEPITDLAKLVDIYFQNILKEYPNEQKYYLAGWSFGGLLAFEVGQLLSQEYGKACEIILFDTLSCDMFREFKALVTSSTYNVDISYGVSDRYIRRSMEAGDIAEDMLLNHKIKTAECKVNLIKAIATENIAEESVRNLIKAYPDNGWKVYCDNLNIVNINADHEGLFDDNLLNELYQIILKIVKRK